MTYRREIPRDLFNEASLLKCWGRLIILLDERRDHTAKINGVADYGHGGERFEIEQDESSGAIFVANFALTIADQPVMISRPLNSREPWPLYCAPSMWGDDQFEECAVFDDEGNLTPEFDALIAGTPSQ